MSRTAAPAQLPCRVGSPRPVPAGCRRRTDGGWTCESIRRGPNHGSFHPSITALEALAAYERSGGAVVDGSHDRLAQAVDKVRRARRGDRRWPMYRPHPDRYWFALEERGASRVCAVRMPAWWVQGRR
jgi:hypothetical protein